MSDLEQALCDELPRTLTGTHFDGLGHFYKGKVRDNYSKDGVRLIVVTDRLSAFDVVLGTIPFKGQVLNELAAYWFDETRALVPNHVIDVPDAQAMRAVECAPVAVEMVMRGYLTGVTSTSIWAHYQAGSRSYCGHALPDGLHKNEPLAHPILTPSTKAEHGGHDESIAAADVIARGIVDQATFDELADMSARLFAFGQKRAAERGLILVDTKYEFGRRPDGRWVVIDEVHTPDSSRYWYADDYEARMTRGEEPRSLDKEYVRRYYAGIGYRGDGPPPPMPDEVRLEAARRYIAAFEQLTARRFVPVLGPAEPRLRQNLGLETR